MTIIAFDVGKKELVGVRTNKNANIQEKFALPNIPEAIDEFLLEAKRKYSHLIVASEATADYHRCLAQKSLALDIPFRLVNPLLTKQFTRATIRKKKTDLTDAHIIAKLVVQGEGGILHSESLDPLKSLNRTVSKVNRLAGILGAIIARFEERSSPQLSKPVLKELGKPFETLLATVRKLRGYLVEKVDKNLKTLVMSIPGVGPTLAVSFITEIGDIRRFPSAKSLVAYAGLDPKVKQSGIGLKRNTKITKRGSPYLRRSAYIAAYIAKRCDPELKMYFQKKRQEGKFYKEATVATARKIISRLYAVWKRGTPYIKKSLNNT